MTPPAAHSPPRAASELDALLTPPALRSSELPLPAPAIRERLDSVEAVNKALALSVGEVAAPDEAADALGFRCVLFFLARAME